MTQLTLWKPTKRRRRSRRRPGEWVPRCEDCGRRIWSAASLRRRFGKLLGERCYRKRRRAARLAARLAVPAQIRVSDPGHIPGQGEIEIEIEEGC